MSKLKIKPKDGNIQIEIEEAVAGALDMSGTHVAREYGKIVAIGDWTEDRYKVGDKIFFKSWAVDIIEHEGKKYYFIDISTKGIKAIVS